MKHNGFTLTELMILIAIIGILAVLIAGAFTPKKAGAATSSPIPTELRYHSVQFMYSTEGNLTIFNTGNHTWKSAEAVCDELKPLDANLKHVTLSLAQETSAVTELVWDSDRTKLTNLSGLNEADCN